MLDFLDGVLPRALNDVPVSDLITATLTEGALVIGERNPLVRRGTIHRVDLEGSVKFGLGSAAPSSVVFVGPLIVVGLFTGEILVLRWDVRNRRLVETQRIQAHPTAVCTLCTLADGCVVSSGDDRTIRTWFLKNDKLVHGDTNCELRDAVTVLVSGVGSQFFAGTRSKQWYHSDAPDRW